MTPSNRQKRFTGFTMIELVIVIAVVALLALMALPSLYGQTVKQQIRDSLPLLEIAKGGVTGFYNTNGEMPADNAAAKVPEAKKLIGSYVSSVTVKEGAITITFGNNSHPKLKDKKLTIRPAYVKGEKIVPIAWVCAARKVPQGMEVAGANETDLPPDSLPVECR